MAKPSEQPTKQPAEPVRQNPADYGRRRVPQGGEPTPVEAPVPAVPEPVGGPLAGRKE